MTDVELEVVDAPEPQGTAPEPPEGEAPEPVDTPPAEPSWREHPEFQAVLARQQQLEQRLAQYERGSEPQGDPVDLNEFLNPLGDSFGENLARFLADRDQHITRLLDERFAPIQEREQQARLDAGKQAVEQLIAAQWDETTDGQLTDDHRETIDLFADRYLLEENQRLGVRTDQAGAADPRDPMAKIAARAALVRATEKLRQINRNALTRGAQANVDGLAAVQQLPGDVKAGAAAHDVAPTPRSGQELMEKYFGEAGRLLAR